VTAAVKGLQEVSRDWTQPEFMRIAATIEEITGIAFPPNRRASAETVMRKVMSRLGMTSPVSLEIGVSRRGAVLEALLDDLTIGESYFFREPAQLRFMADELLPKWSAEWDPSRKLRVWSAGCAAGQEPYSIAIMLSDAGWRPGAEILATDISEARLEVARKASFSKWSLRTLPAESIDRWFDRKGTEFRLVPEIRSQVDFRALNLLDPTPRPETQNQDVIFCRNVLIYFELPAIITIAERLLQALAPDGWLFLGASDPHLAELTACEVVVLPGCTGYRKTSAAQSTYALRNAPLTLIIPDESLNPPVELDDLPEAQPKALTRQAEVAPHAAPPAVATEAVSMPDEAALSVTRARSLANEGHLMEAATVCAAALEKFPDQPQLHLIAAVLHGEAGSWNESERAARRALYLDRSLVLAHVALGDAIAHRGDIAGARRSFENAAALLVSAESGDMVDAGDVSVARLTDIVRAHLSMLDRQPGSTASGTPRGASTR
jgi:chemotaxis protein methyltransferase CheR